MATPFSHRTFASSAHSLFSSLVAVFLVVWKPLQIHRKMVILEWRGKEIYRLVGLRTPTTDPGGLGVGEVGGVNVEMDHIVKILRNIFCARPCFFQVLLDEVEVEGAETGWKGEGTV
ncbi:hypothetical protein B0H16DRAFT_1460137 [Mycena metata]|uniref:Uncharacterized protein n=1 Tax=Mycena metata TaxID=1033252 RepID=A0AAD7IXV2_9AGAR|nr:hypothetical protein B0H16DRAFT_1460137 [Mycena metata]